MRAARWAFALLLLPGCSGESDGAPPAAAGTLPEPPDIVLITLDTLRREHLGCYGYFRDTSPRIDALAREGIVFERALASMASTLPSHVTMLTGLYPHQHGMTSNWRGASVAYVSEPGRLSVAEVLKRCGYRTAAFVSAPPLGEITGIDAGFDTFDSAQGTTRRAAETNAHVLAWLAENADHEGPVFLWVHYFDPHEPNDPVEPFDTLFTTDERQLRWIRERGIDPAALTERFGRSERVDRHFLRPTKRVRVRPPPDTEITLERVADMMNRYDGELRYVDEQVGVLLDALKSHGRYSGALIALAADHGQSLGENDWIGHGSITDVNVFVPWVLRLPESLRYPAQRIPSLVSLSDLTPTVLGRFELRGTELLRQQFEGEDVLSGAFARDLALAERTHDALDDGETGLQYALHSGRWKLIHRPGGADELFDRERGGAPVDVAADHPAELARLQAEIHALLARSRAVVTPGKAEPDAELLQSLEELGYGGD